MNKKETKRSERKFPEGSANWLSWISFWWIGDLVDQAWREPIDNTDLYVLPSRDASEPALEEFSKQWDENEKIAPGYRHGLLWTVLSIHKAVAYRSVLLDFVVIAFTLSIPLILERITGILEAIDDGILDQSVRKRIYLLSVTLIGAEMGRLSFSNSNLWLIVRAGVKVRTALMGAMYEKSLFLTGAARQRFSLGRAVNIMSSDILRIDTGWVFVNIFWTTPILIAITFILVYSIIGWASLAGFAVLLAYLPIQHIIVERLNWYRDKINEVTDKRIKMLQEVMLGIRVIKLYSWEERFQLRVNELRQEELRLIRRMKMIAAISQTLTISVPTFITVASLVAYAWIYGSVSSSVIFPAMAFFDLLETPLNYLPITISYTVDALAAVKRVQSFLRAAVLVFEPEIDILLTEAVLIEHGKFAWDDPEHPQRQELIEEYDDKEVHKQKEAKETSQKRKGSLTVPKAGVYDVQDARWMASTPAPFSGISINHFSVKRGELIAVVGPVGSGKSSLLSCIMGEMFKIEGRVRLGGRLGFSSQHSWIRSGSIRDNILFGSPIDPQLYATVINQCALESDLHLMPDGDLTVIGEKGVCLSGGQKQRLSLARMVYFDPDIALMDDPLSAVDPHVGKILFRDCILKGHLSTKTRILVTHQLNVLEHCDRIVVMKHGQIDQVGTYRELIDSGSAFSELLVRYAKMEQEETETIKKAASLQGHVQEQVIPSSPAPPPSPTPIPPPPKDDLHKTQVTLEGYIRYAAYGGGFFFLFTAFITGFMSEMGRAFSDLWLKWWPDAESDPFGWPDRSYMMGLAMIGVFQTAMTWFNGLVFVLAGYFASLVLHQKALHRVLRSPIRFFDCTPAGRILNRFSKDMDLTDSNLPEELNNLMYAVSVIISTVAITGYCEPWLLLIMPFPLIAGYILQSMFSACARQLQRLNVSAFSPLLSHFSETYTGLSLIRSLRKQSMFIARHHVLNDTCNRSYLLYAAVRRWTSFRSESIGAILTLGISWIGTYLEFSASVFGLALTQALKITRALDWSIKQFAETEISMVSAERIMEYAERLESERDMINPENRPPASWPSDGSVKFVDLNVRYRPHLPPVLKNINLEFRSRERVAIVGRTGAGKSTILSVLFRLVEPHSGQIFVDGLDICSIGLQDLRKRLAIVPQEPILFAGTLRFNLDPMDEYTDDELWLALERTHMSETVKRMCGDNVTLELDVMENGDNFSIGQKQLLCLTRAVLKKTSVLVLDEATANIDLETDALIQQSLRENFSNSHTIITIAHRLNTIIDYDKVVVMRAGEVVEFDSPKNLIARPQSLFSQMIRESSAHRE